MAKGVLKRIFKNSLIEQNEIENHYRIFCFYFTIVHNSHITEPKNALIKMNNMVMKGNEYMIEFLNLMFKEIKISEKK